MIDLKSRSIPNIYGFIPRKWKEITDVELLKKEGVYDIEKMRIITILNEEFNINNKKLGRDTMKIAEKHNMICKEQYGGRKGLKSITVVLNKVLTLDLLRFRKQAGIICSNDAKSCFDRVVHPIAALEFRRNEANKKNVEKILEVFGTGKHKISTGYGLSENKYDCKGNHRQHQGLGQGSGAAPDGWIFISSIIINMMKTSGLKFCSQSAIKK